LVTKKNERKIVLQQVLDPRGSGGVSAEFRALNNSKLKEKYLFVPMILENFHKGLNIKDIYFYYKQINAAKPDIVQIRGAAIDSLNAVIAAKLANKAKILVCVHGMYSDLVFISKFKKNLSKFVVEPLIFSISDGISCVYERASLRDNFSRYTKKMLPYVYNRIPDFSIYDRLKYRQEIREDLGIPNQNHVGVLCGRITREKGFHILVKTIQNLDFDWPVDFSILILGDGNYLQTLKEEISKLKNCKSIFIVGNKTEVFKYLFASDFFIQPSLHENLSISLLEASAAKLPMIATNVGGTSEIITNNQNGLLICKNDSKSLNDAILKMINDKEFYNFCLKNISKSNFDRFSDVEVDKQLESVYSKIMRENK